MKSNYKKIGSHIRLVDERNKGLRVTQLLGLSISKRLLLQNGGDLNYDHKSANTKFLMRLPKKQESN